MADGGASTTTSADAERAAYFQGLARRILDRAAELADAPPAGGSASPCGEDLAQPDLDLIAAAFATPGGLPAWQEAQGRELAFWRWLAFNGYAGQKPGMFPLFQEHFMVSTFYRTGWAMAEFRDAAIIEIGCGPLGMIEYLPAARRLAFDPLNESYTRLFGKCRDPGIKYISEPEQLRREEGGFDLAICHNALDHTEDPALWFETLFAKLAMGGRFILQVNLSRPEPAQSAEHRRMHPSPLLFEQVMAWLSAKSDDFAHFCETAPNGDNEFYFLAWGRKTHDLPVTYRRPLIAETAPPQEPAAPPAPQSGSRPLTTSFASTWLTATTIKGSAEPFANLPPIADLGSEPAVAETARAEFRIAEPVAGYRLRDTAPIPAPSDREGYYGENHLGYWLSGLSDALSIKREAARLGIGPKPRYFELGCASGRVVRHIAFHTEVPITCCDINKRHTEWVRLFLPPRINVFHNSVNPVLPLEDNSVDIAAAFSVFTHIDDFETAWLFELRRILRPGGLAYLTVATDHTWEQYKQLWIKEQLSPLADKIADYGVDDTLFAGPLPREKTVFWWRGDREVYAAMAFHSALYIRREWGRIFTVRDILPDRHFYQDVVLLTK